MSVWDGKKEILYGNGSVGEVSQTSPAPKCEVNDTDWYGWLSVSDLFITGTLSCYIR